MKKKIIISCVFFALVGLFSAFWVTQSQLMEDTVEPKTVAEQTKPADDSEAKTVQQKAGYENKFHFTLNEGSNLTRVLSKRKVPKKQIYNIVQAANEIYPIRQLRTNSKGILYFSKKPIVRINALRVDFSKTQYLVVRWSQEFNRWLPKIHKKPSKIRTIAFNGTVALSLWDSAKQAGMPPALISELAEIFAWQFDFSREVRSGDRWRLVVEQTVVDNRPIASGKILIAEYQTSSRNYTAIRYEKPNGRFDYFTPDGDSLKRMFLRSPIKFARISSRFARRRYHPILKRNKPHLGVDYAAAPGTPIKAVGDGVVQYAQWKGAGGRVVKIKHMKKYATAYMHLRSYAKDIKKGARVQQGQIIGYVGSSGRATGPHLHFSFYAGGKYVDPLGMKFPSADSLDKSQMADFREKTSYRLSKLQPWGSKSKTIL